jgi:hypothetical protein
LPCARKFQYDIDVAQVGINVALPVPVAYFSFTRSRASKLGDLGPNGKQARQFWMQTKTVTSRWFAPNESGGQINTIDIDEVNFSLLFIQWESDREYKDRFYRIGQHGHADGPQSGARRDVGCRPRPGSRQRGARLSPAAMRLDSTGGADRVADGPGAPSIIGWAALPRQRRFNNKK